MKGTHRVMRVTGGRVAVLNTSRLPDTELNRAIRLLAKEIDLSHVIIHMKNLGEGRASLGRAYSRVPRIANTNGLKRREWYYMITATYHQNWVGTLAHEGKHVEQFRERLSISEVSCDHFADWFQTNIWDKKEENG